MDSITIDTARRVMLAAQGLDRLPKRRARKADVLEAIRRMGVLQIDTIHVIARSPYLVLWSRLGDYRPKWLDELLAEGALFEYWAHAMCFLPIEDFPLSRRRMLDLMQGSKWPVGWAVNFIREKPEAIEKVLSHMHANGGVRSAEFENPDRPPGGWWNWKEEKDALESLFLTGEVMIARREKFQRVYDLRERVLPGAGDKNLPTTEEVRRALTLRAVNHLGVALPAWVPDYYRQPKMGIAAYLASLAAEGLLTAVEVEGLSGPAYAHPDRLGLLEQAASGKVEP
ncbi:MAG TPA: crosslink repair DNA glycosylase YcaQ family protein, partial [Anaerolineales bacterium]